MNILLNTKNIADAIKSWLGVITVFTAAAFSMFEYIEHKQSVRVERSLSYVENFRDSSAADARLALNQLIAENQTELNTLLGAKYNSAEKLNNAYSQFILKLTSPTTVQRNLEVAFSFFEEAAICVQRELCDDEVIRSFFVNEVRAMYNAFYPFVCQLRSQWNNPDVYLKLEKYYIDPVSNICQLSN